MKGPTSDWRRREEGCINMIRGRIMRIQTAHSWLWLDLLVLGHSNKLLGSMKIASFLPTSASISSLELYSTEFATTLKSGYTLVTLLRIVTPYRDSVEEIRDCVTYQNLVTPLSYGFVRCAVGISLSHQKDDTVTAGVGVDV
jgi:hypothetical protein